MKTSNLVALIIALLISTGGFAGINFLFTQVAAASDHSTLALIVRA